MHSKMQSTPTPRYIENPIELEDSQTIDQANAQIAMLGTLLVVKIKRKSPSRFP
jgi:hypothetical protein